jgi:hypothetical protein
MKFGKTAAYTILKNEKAFIEKWLYYTKDFDYRVLLDTGSTDGSWELLKEYSKSDSRLIIQQYVFTPWKFDVARRYNLNMVPTDVDWCLSPDLDEYFTINVIEKIEHIIETHPNVTNISCDRFDVYSNVPRVGPPENIPSNKIHRRNDYTWVQPIYEHLSWIHKDRPEIEIYCDELYLVHDQDFRKKERSELYTKMLIDEYESNPSNTWCLWFLVNHYYREKDMENFIKTGCDYIKYHTQPCSKYKEVLSELTNIYLYADIDTKNKDKIFEIIKGKSI